MALYWCTSGTAKVKMPEKRQHLLLVLLLACLYSVTWQINDSNGVDEGRQLIEDIYNNFSASISSSNPVDIIFVLDRSASVTETGWQSMLRFVQNFLEHFTIDADNTRVSVISYGTTASLDIDGVSSGQYNKCSFVDRLQRQMAKKVPSGYSATHDGLLRARDAVLTSRPTAKKAVVVITDGKSNVGPPAIRASIQLRSLTWDQAWNVTSDGPQLQVYAFGIKDAYMPEVRSIASPLPNHTFYIPTFQAFAELARSLHDDSQSENWHVLSDSAPCRGACNDHAYCACGTRSGQYLCICRDGYQGDGITCTACPKGTFKNSISPGRCVLCPSNATTLVEGSADVKQCLCQPPLYQDSAGLPCQIRHCNSLPDIEHGHKFHVAGQVVDELPDTGTDCKNLPDSSCHFKCDLGYRLDGHPGLVCHSNGSWEGNVPSCHIVDCDTLSYHQQQPTHASVEYVNHTTTYGSVVRVECHAGWRTFGDTERVCTHYGVWSGTQTWCVENHCQALPLTPGLIIMPASCGQAAQVPGTRCEHLCGPGYNLVGPAQVLCTEHGTWDNETTAGCVDILPPMIFCPANITTPVTTANFALVHLKSHPPLVTDNSDEFSITRIGVSEYEDPMQLTPGFHQIKYIARDKAGNEGTCLQGITVVDFLVHLVTCPELDITINMTSHQQQAIWPEVIFADHNNVTVAHTCVPTNNTILPAGIYNVTCVPDTRSYQTAHCRFRAIFRQPRCDIPPPPLHGSVSCAQTATSLLTCVPSCNENYDFHYPPQGAYICDLDGIWKLRQAGNFWPDCSKRTYYPRKALLRGQAKYYYYGGNCEDIKDEIADKFTDFLESQAWQICGAETCNIERVNVSCGRNSKRKRRSVKQKTGAGKETVSKEHENILRNILLNATLKSMPLQERKMTLPSSQDMPQSDSSKLVIIKRSVEGTSLNLDTPDVPENQNAGPSNSSLPPLDYFFDHVAPQNISEKEAVEVKVEFEVNKEVLNGTVNATQQIELLTTLQRICDKLDMSLVSHNLTLDYGNMTSSMTGESDESNTLIPYHHVIDYPVLDDCDYGFVPRSDAVLYTHYCVACPAGSQYVSGQCLICPPAYYQPEEAQTNCLPCPGDTLTEFPGADNISMCLAMCDAGQFSGTGLAPCQLCPLHSYQPLSSATTCLPCPMGRKTLRVGATHAVDCLDLCDAGTYSETGLVPCLPCPIGTYQPNVGAAECLLCDDGTTTNTQAASNVTECVEWDACTSSNISCENSGQCVTLNNVASCVCMPGFSGSSCEINIPDCFSFSCQNNGTCVDGINNFTCACFPGFTGSRCEVNIDECSSSPCQHGSSCLDLFNGYQCFCLFDYNGINCETKMVPCERNPCIHGQCEERDGLATCVCSQGFAGTTCNMTYDLCSSHPCAHAGQCISTQGEFQCQCMAGYTGTLCDIALDPCRNSNCSSVSTCIPAESILIGYVCKCPGGWSGKFCDLEETTDFDLVFNTDGPVGQYVVLPPEFMPSLLDFSVCAWLRPLPLSAFATIVAFTLPHSSLTIQGNDYYEDRGTKEFDIIFSLRHTDKLIMDIFGHSLLTNVTLTFYVWSHLCVTWSCTSSHWQILINGSVTADGTLDQRWSSLPSHLHVVLGQSNPYYAEASSLWDVYAGEITQFNIFSQVLSLDNLRGLASGKPCNTTFGDVISWTDVTPYTKGNLVIRETSHCLDINECWLSTQFPCGNNRDCVDLVGSYDCTLCKYGYTGNNCEDPADECVMDKCFRGECVDGPEPYDFQCICPPGFTGYQCEDTIDLCLSEPCQNGGTCISRPNTFSCTCPMENMGPMCERPSSACLPNRCQNGGICIEKIDDTFECSCPGNFAGRFCERSKHWCEDNVCYNGGVCQNSTVSLQNNMISRTLDESFCQCQNGWMGRQCEVRMIISCDLSPCVNGGTCHRSPDSERGYVCRCLDMPGVKLDENCEYLNQCDLSPCANNSLCVLFLNQTFVCICPGGRQCDSGGHDQTTSNTSSEVLSQPSEKITASDANLTATWIWVLVTVSAIFLLFVVPFAACILWRRKCTRSHGEVLNTISPDDVRGDMTNPAFYSEELQLEESMYAELGDTYDLQEDGSTAEDLRPHHGSVKSANIQRGSATSYISSSLSGSYSSLRSSSLSKKTHEEDDTDKPLLSDDYLEPAVLGMSRVGTKFNVTANTNLLNPSSGVDNSGFEADGYIISDSIRLSPRPDVSNAGFDPSDYIISDRNVSGINVGAIGKEKADSVDAAWETEKIHYVNKYGFQNEHYANLGTDDLTSVTVSESDDRKKLPDLDDRQTTHTRYVNIKPVANESDKEKSKKLSTTVLV